MEEKLAFITNISFPTTLEELLYFMEENGKFNVEDVLNETYLEWTAPKWCKKGTIVFFMHSKTSNSTISALKKEFNKMKSNYNDEEVRTLEYGLKHGTELYKKYGGTIYAIGIVNGEPFVEENILGDVNLHWKSNIYAPIKKLYVLDSPISIKLFNDFIKVSRTGAITPLSKLQLEELMNIISSYNNVKKIFKEVKKLLCLEKKNNNHSKQSFKNNYGALLIL